MSSNGLRNQFFKNEECLEVKLVAFELGETFHLDYENLESETSIYLWNKLELLLEKTFGDIEVDLSLVNLREGFCARNLREGSIIVYVEILSIRNRKNPTERICNKDNISLLKNDKESCKIFLGYNSTNNDEGNCWKKRAEKIFMNEGIQFLGVYLNPTINPICPTTSSTSSNKTTTLTEFKFAESRNIEFHEKNKEKKWNIIKPSLDESFGLIEVIYTCEIYDLENFKMN